MNLKDFQKKRLYRILAKELFADESKKSSPVKGSNLDLSHQIEVEEIQQAEPNKQWTDKVSVFCQGFRIIVN